MAGRIDEAILARKISSMFPGKEDRVRRILSDYGREEGEKESSRVRLAT